MSQPSSDAERKKKIQADRLEMYLQGIFQEECEFKVDKEDVKFIQQSIETLLQSFIDSTLADDRVAVCLEQLLDQLERDSSEFTVYFPSNLDERFKKYINHKTARIPLIGVGSFYEGTKTVFPDEFDFIFSLATVTDKRYNGIMLNLKISMKEACNNFEMVIYDGKRKMAFFKFLGIHGPAYSLQFQYTNSFNHKRFINVDLVLAIQSHVAKIKMADIYKHYLDKRCAELKSFHDKVMTLENLFFIKYDLSLAPVESDFIKKDLSENHRKVYRILKYLINGQVDEDKIKEALLPDATKTGYASYHIKIMILYHHDTCRNCGTEDVGPCVLQVLEQMNKYEDTSNFPMFKNFCPCRSFTLLPYLKRLLQTLRRKQSSQTGMYEYEAEKILSVSSQFLDDCLTKSGETASSDTHDNNLDIKIGNHIYWAFRGGKQVWLPPDTIRL